MAVKQVKRSVVPVYLIGVVWLGYALLFPLRSLPELLLCGVLSVLAYIAGRAIFPDREFRLPEEKAEAQARPAEKKPAADPAIEAMLKERDRAVSEMRRLNEAIPDEKVSAQIDHLEEVTRKIIDQVADKPEKLPQIRRFLDYYLPTTLKLLNTYDRMGAAGVSGTNINATREKVEKMMDTIAEAFDRQLDALFGSEAMDVAADITVMENLLAQEGLSGRDFDGGNADGEIRLEL